ncbi:hypothetical protein SRABI106_02636 [Rahnella aquatilis]|nr:hypothetical protein SRABI106_02636 [Rahnella aquatilis]
MAAVWRQTDGECCTFFYQHHVVLAVHQVLTNCRNLDVDLCFVTQLLDDLHFAGKRHFSDVAWQKMFRADTQ